MSFSFLSLVKTKILCLNTELEVEFPALFQGLDTVIGIPLDILKQAFRGLSIRVKDVFYDIKSEDFLLQLLLISIELLLLNRNLSCQHSLPASLLFAC